MNQVKNDRFFETLRKEKDISQEQMAGVIAVSCRSVGC